MRVEIEAPFGHFKVPFSNMGGRTEFGPNSSSARWELAGNGSFKWSSFSVAFWMPDGAGVYSDPSGLLNHKEIDPRDLVARRASVVHGSAGWC